MQFKTFTLSSLVIAINQEDVEMIKRITSHKFLSVLSAIIVLVTYAFTVAVNAAVLDTSNLKGSR